MKKMNIIAGFLVLVSGMHLVAMDKQSTKGESPKRERKLTKRVSRVFSQGIDALFGGIDFQKLEQDIEKKRMATENSFPSEVTPILPEKDEKSS